MSYSASIWVYENSPTSGIDRSVLLALAFHCQKDGWTCWPGIERIAAYVNVSTSTVQRTLRRLETDGHIVIDRQGARDERIAKNRRPNLYTLLDLSTGVAPVATPVSAWGVKSSILGSQNRRLGVAAGDTQIDNEYIKNPEDEHSCPNCDYGYVWDGNTVSRCQYA